MEAKAKSKKLMTRGRGRERLYFSVVTLIFLDLFITSRTNIPDPQEIHAPPN
jgi:hypothetical protein